MGIIPPSRAVSTLAELIYEYPNTHSLRSYEWDKEHLSEQGKELL